MNSLYWHDYETFGVNPPRDKPSQFAGIRTNEQLDIVGEPLVIFCQPPLDCLPSPMACLVTGISPQLAQQKGIPEPKFIRQIHNEMLKPGTCSLGYNSIRFDDEVTRYSLYRNFYDPYEREWKNGNSRWDIIDMVRLTRALRPEGITWPDHDDGGPNFRLESLTAANGISHDSAHDALSDVLATIELAKLIKKRQPKLYNYVYTHRTKQKVAELVNLYQPKPFLHVSSRLPRENGYTGIMLPIAMHPKNKNAIICFNLMGDIEPLLQWDTEKIKQRLFTARAGLDEGDLRVLLKAVHLNKCPVVATVKLLDASGAKRLNIDLNRCEENWKSLQQHNISEKIAEVFSESFFPDYESAEQNLYSGFLPNCDKPLLEQVRGMTGAELLNSPPMFQDKRYQELLYLYRARFFNQTLTPDEQLNWRAFRQARILEGAEGYQSLEAYNQELTELSTQEPYKSHAGELIAQLRQWGQTVSDNL